MSTSNKDNDGNMDDEVLTPGVVVVATTTAITTATATSSKATTARRTKRKRETKPLTKNKDDDDNNQLSLKDESDYSTSDSEATFHSTESYCEALLHQTQIEIQECQEKELRLHNQLARKRDLRLKKEKKTGRQYDEVKWMKMYLRLRDYKKTHQGREPGRKNPSNEYFKLGLWVDNQRRYFRQDKQLPHRIELLQKINFQFTPQQQIHKRQTYDQKQSNSSQMAKQHNIQEKQADGEKSKKRPPSTATTTAKKRKKTNSSSSSTTKPKKKKHKQQKQHDNDTNKELIV